MAQRRMVSQKIIDTDEFLSMPLSSRLLYYDFIIRADDDGFVSSPKKIMRFVGGSEDDFKILCAKSFIIPFESGICVIKDWKIHNYIQADRYHETLHLNEKNKLLEDKNGSYLLIENRITECIQNGSEMDTEVRLGKVSKGKVSKGKVSKGKNDFVSPTPEEVTDYGKQSGFNIDGVFICRYYDPDNTGQWIDSKGNKVKSWKQKVLSVWCKDDKKINNKYNDFYTDNPKWALVLEWMHSPEYSRQGMKNILANKDINQREYDYLLEMLKKEGRFNG